MMCNITAKKSLFCLALGKKSNPALSASYSIKLIKIDSIEKCYAETRLRPANRLSRFEVRGQAAEGTNFSLLRAQARLAYFTLPH